jgi:uncharacterized cupredoxin-like copper-binding protein
MRNRRAISACAFIGIALATAACGGSDDKKATAGASPGVINVTLGEGQEFKLAADQATATAGSITFAVANKGKAEHEMVVVPLASGANVDSLSANGEANEDGSPGEVEALAPGANGSITLDLKAGTYALICNEPGHFAGGMHQILTVS